MLEPGMAVLEDGSVRSVSRATQATAPHASGSRRSNCTFGASRISGLSAGIASGSRPGSRTCRRSRSTGTLRAVVERHHRIVEACRANATLFSVWSASVSCIMFGCLQVRIRLRDRKQTAQTRVDLALRGRQGRHGLGVARIALAAARPDCAALRAEITASRVSRSCLR